MKKKMKNPIISTVNFKEILKMEANKFCIEAYNDFVNIDGEHVFDKSEAKMIFKQILQSLKEVYQSAKSDLERDRAREAIETLKIVPYKIH